MEAQIGYKKGDSGWLFSQNDSGLRFLGLTACLVTVDHWTAAEALRELITDTASDRKLIPPSQQLKQLIRCLDYRLSKSGFPDSVLAWGIWLNNATQKPCNVVRTPSGKVIRELIKATSSLARLGQTHKVQIKVLLSQGAWVIAFLKWCLGVPPSVMMNSKRPLLTQPDSTVLVDIVLESEDGEIEVRMLDEVGNITELVRELSGVSCEFMGMVQVRTYAQNLLQHIGPPDSIQYRACLEAIPYGCCQAVKIIQTSSKLCESRFKSDTKSGLSYTLGSIFPDEGEIEKAMGLFLGLDMISFKVLPYGLRIVDLPLLSLAQKSICSVCLCRKCQKEPWGIAKYTCRFDIFMRSVSHCVATILLISLLIPSCPQGVLLQYQSSAPSPSSSFTTAVCDIFAGDSGTCVPGAVIERILDLVGNKAGEYGPDTWIMSSARGQTIYPELLETLTVGKTGLLRLRCVPGRIYWKDIPYTLVENLDGGLDHTYSSDSSLENDESNEVVFGTDDYTIQVPCDSYTSTQTIWNISTRDDKLNLSICAPGLAEMPDRNPIIAIRAALESWFVDCCHDRMAKLTRANAWLFLISPGNPDPLLNSGSAIGVVQSDKNERMRFLLWLLADLASSEAMLV